MAGSSKRVHIGSTMNDSGEAMLWSGFLSSAVYMEFTQSFRAVSQRSRSFTFVPRMMSIRVLVVAMALPP